jgi:hypothetical protein
VCVCATVNYEVCNIAIVLYLNVIKRDCNQSVNKPNHPN